MQAKVKGGVFLHGTSIPIPKGGPQHRQQLLDRIDQYPIEEVIQGFSPTERHTLSVGAEPYRLTPKGAARLTMLIQKIPVARLDLGWVKQETLPVILKALGFCESMTLGLTGLRVEHRDRNNDSDEYLSDKDVDILRHQLQTMGHATRPTIELNWKRLTRSQRELLAPFAPCFTRQQAQERGRQPHFMAYPETIAYSHGPSAAQQFDTIDRSWSSLLDKGGTLLIPEAMTLPSFQKKRLNLQDTPCDSLQLLTLGLAAQDPNFPIEYLALGPVNAAEGEWEPLLRALASSPIKCIDFCWLRVMGRARTLSEAQAREEGLKELKRMASREVLPLNIRPEAYLNADDLNQLLQAIRQRPRTLEIRLDVRLLDARGKATLNQLAGTRIKVVDVALTEQPCMPEDAKALTKQWLAWFQRSNADAVKQAMDKPQNRLRILNLQLHHLSGEQCENLKQAIHLANSSLVEVHLGMVRSHGFEWVRSLFGKRIALLDLTKLDQPKDGPHAFEQLNEQLFEHVLTCEQDQLPTLVLDFRKLDTFYTQYLHAWGHEHPKLQAIDGKTQWMPWTPSEAAEVKASLAQLLSWRPPQGKFDVFAQLSRTRGGFWPCRNMLDIQRKVQQLSLLAPGPQQNEQLRSAMDAVLEHGSLQQLCQVLEWLPGRRLVIQRVSDADFLLSAMRVVALEQFKIDQLDYGGLFGFLEVLPLLSTTEVDLSAIDLAIGMPTPYLYSEAPTHLNVVHFKALLTALDQIDERSALRRLTMHWDHFSIEQREALRPYLAPQPGAEPSREIGAAPRKRVFCYAGGPSSVLQSTPTVQAAPTVPVPTVSLPSVSLPSVSLPSVSLPSISVPRQPVLPEASFASLRHRMLLGLGGATDADPVHALRQGPPSALSDAERAELTELAKQAKATVDHLSRQIDSQARAAEFDMVLNQLQHNFTPGRTELLKNLIAPSGKLRPCSAAQWLELSRCVHGYREGDSADKKQMAEKLIEFVDATETASTTALLATEVSDLIAKGHFNEACRVPSRQAWSGKQLAELQSRLRRCATQADACLKALQS